MSIAAHDPEPRIVALLQGLQQLGWAEGRNVRIDIRWGGGDAGRIRRYAAELVALAPDVILAPGSATLVPLLEVTRAVPIVFVHVPIRWALATSIAWHGPAATQLDLPTTNTASVGSGWNCSSRSPERDASGVIRDAAISAGTRLVRRSPFTGVVGRSVGNPG